MFKKLLVFVVLVVCNVINIKKNVLNWFLIMILM